MNIIDLTLTELRDKIRNKELKPSEALNAYLKQIEKNKHLNAVLEVFEDSKDIAKEKDKLQGSNKMEGRLFGVPVIIKDNILYKGHKASCASKFLKDYVAINNSTVTDKLLAEGAVIIGRSNMDEFAMGSSNENSAYGPCLNPLDNSRVPGGSSGGSAASVAANLCAASLGSDTGGSIREPASFCGVVGIKPTYGRVSRSGLIAYASSLDQIGPITKTVEDNALMLEIISGYSEKDETSVNKPVGEYVKACGKSVNGLKIGIIKEVLENCKVSETDLAGGNFLKFVKFLEKTNKVYAVSVKDIYLALPTYYILSTAEATSNLARFDGIKYTTRSKEAKTTEEIYVKSRSEGFGKEVKRRIMLGNFVLSSGYFDAYYGKAKQVQELIKNQFTEAFKTCDVIVMPATLGEAYKLNSKTNPLDAYVEDLFTVPANIAGIPAITVPYSKGANKMPLGVQLLANHFEEEKLYSLASYIEKNYKETK